MEKRKVVKVIDYQFQNEFQLTKAYDDSNTMVGLSDDFDKFVVGRLSNGLSIHTSKGYKVVFLPSVGFSSNKFINFILEDIKPDVVHLHGNHGWAQYQYYAEVLRDKVDKLIFSPAGSSCGTPSFISNFDYVIVNHPLQVGRIKCHDKDIEKIVVRRRAVNPDFFFPKYKETEFDFVYVAGFVPVKKIPDMIETVLYSSKKRRTLVIVGDFKRTREYHHNIKNFIISLGEENRIILKDFMDQESFVDFLGRCGVFVWPNIKPENPETTTNRSIVEALGCGMPLLLGERAFKQTEFVDDNVNGLLFNSFESFGDLSEKIFENISKFREGSVKLAKERFSYKENFIDFYNEIYS